MSPNRPIRVAFGSIPKESGTFTFYRNQRPELLKQGVELICVSVGAEQAALWDKRFEDDGCVQLAANEQDSKKLAQTFVEWCDANQIDIVIGINSIPILSAINHLPENIRAVARCANAFDYGYRVTMIGRRRLARIVALTPRLRDDLVADYGADPKIIQLIPNGIEPTLFESAAAAERGTQTPIRLGFLGRLEHNQKGVLFLPEIIQRLDHKGLDYRLQIAGQGKHGKQLSRMLKPQITAGKVEMIGAISPQDVPAFLQQTDIYLFTSQFEGCPNALLEAMMAGCVPVSWNIKGITDFVIDDKKTGFLISMGETSAFADTIFKLSSHPEQLTNISRTISREARARFSNEICASEYARLFGQVMSGPPPAWEPLAWDNFELDPIFRRSKWDWIPKPIKTMIKAGLRTFSS